MKKKRRKRKTIKRREKTVIILKPDCVQKKLIGRVLFRIEHGNGLTIDWLRVVNLDKKFTKKLYKPLQNKLSPKLFNSICNWISSDNIVLGTVSGINAIKKIRKICGATNPVEAVRGTIRRDFATDDLRERAKKNLPTRNIIHASASKKEALYELNLVKRFM